MTEAQLMLSDQIEGYPHPKLTETLYGHEYQEKEFIDCYNSNKLHHGWLITGPEGIGKATLAWRIAKYVLTQPIEKIETNSFFDELSEPNIPKLDEQSKNSIEARILAESEPRLAVIRKSYDEKRKTFRTSIGIDEIRRLSAFFPFPSVTEVVEL